MGKIAGESLCTYYSEVYQAFDVITLIIGWCQYDDPRKFIGTYLETYIRCLWLSKRDAIGFFLAAIFSGSKIPNPGSSDDLKIKSNKEQEFTKDCKHTRVFCVSNNTWNIFDMEDSIKALNYIPMDNVEDFFMNSNENR